LLAHASVREPNHEPSPAALNAAEPEVSAGPQSHVRVLHLDAPRAHQDIQRSLGLKSPMATLVLVGGAASLGEVEAQKLRPHFVEGLAPAAEQAGAAVIDGGTDAGVMRLMGRARAQIGALFPLIGVAAAATIVSGEETEDASDKAPVEPNHTHILLTPGDRWGDESPWIADIAGMIAGDSPSVTVLVGGGAIAWEDVENSVAAGRPVIVVAGSGGTADALAAALCRQKSDSRAERLIGAGRFQIVSAASGPEALREAALAALTRREMRPASPEPERPSAPKDAGGDVQAIRWMIESLALPPEKKRFLDARWLDQMQWMDRKAAECQRKYYWSRKIVIICTTLAPVLIMGSAVEGKGVDLGSLSAGSSWPSLLPTLVRVLGAVLSLAAALAAAYEEFFRNGDRWRHYRHTTEKLKSEGWLFLELCGPYERYKSHARAHAAFVLVVEQLLGQDVEQFLSEIAVEERKEKRRGAKPTAGAGRTPPAPDLEPEGMRG
jgi:hypothetical protein